MKKIFKAVAVAFSMYSKIPMPRFTWASEDMQYSLIFFPFVGAVIGILEWGLFVLSERLKLPNLCTECLAVLLPILITGGFHIDGFMDTCDALHSYQPRERKLQILKDPHIGAFSVICLASVLCGALGAVSCLQEERVVLASCTSFFLSRVLSGIGVMTLASAKKEGMLFTTSANSKKKVVLWVLLLELVLGCALIAWFCQLAGILEISIMGVIFLYYVWKSNKEFGGITGDLAGYFVTLSEVVSVVCLAVYSITRS